MRIEILTDGMASGTTVSINGRPVDWAEIDFNISTLKRGTAAKLCMAVWEKNEADKSMPHFVSYYAHDFRKYDELQNVNGDVLRQARELRNKEVLLDDRKHRSAGDKRG